MTQSRLTRKQDTMSNEVDYVELGLTCTYVCEALNRGLDGRRANELSQPILDAIEQLRT